ncbi:preprotein translocase subunit SecY [Parachryseolinea silvisoli]|jgi:preprotein translocase subunit SecY|uniref:preprotein translocase subunit SecY n=1 Tax=Parachryseolinea silvisoli TaxID=2873601 RepID=UPI0022658AAB|nr:preprotein translocase subunit SecY [Parachryseolinea silvisoli]MCD9017264.1 preprotein translocase subunit SecY [Parachryseolinea silvisoli]
MKRFIQTIRNIFSIEDLRVRILNTIGFLVIFRLGSYIVLPGINPNLLDREANSSGILGYLNNFLGGAFSNASIFALGIMPYISASIIVQLLTFAVPYFQKLQKEGESGRKRLNQLTRVLTIFITVFQGYSYLKGTIDPAVIIAPGVMFYVTSLVLIIAGTMFCMWLGERITDKGIGNGISMLIMIGIVSRLPLALAAELTDKFPGKAIFFIVELFALFGIVVAVIALTQATRRIPIQYAKQVIGNKLYGGKRDFIPLKLNSAGVMPIIFAQALMFIPALVAGLWSDSDLGAYIGSTFSDPYSWQYSLVFALMILIFTFFYTAITINSNDIADNLKRNGGFIPGVKPGKQTADFIDTVLSRITFPGALFLAAIAVLPAFAVRAGVGQNFAQFFGGTSLLILVGVVLDTLQQIESYLLMRHYEGMMKSGRVKGRSQFAAA